MDRIPLGYAGKKDINPQTRGFKLNDFVVIKYEADVKIQYQTEVIYNMRIN